MDLQIHAPALVRRYRACVERGSLALVFLLIGGCDLLSEPESPPPGIQLTTDQRTVSPGSRVTLVLRNGSASALWYNLSCSDLEQETGGRWEPVDLGRGCYLYAEELPPGQTARFDHELPGDLPEGTYRFVTNARKTVASNTFTVRRYEKRRSFGRSIFE
jgi:hypothetical protein